GFGTLDEYTSPDDLLFQLPWGRVASYRIPSDSVDIGPGQCGIASVNFDGVAGRMYRATWDGQIISSAA
ncbi:hypothetical protein, partial [Escherichia coli]|uniref:hypothetical protein n=1 Tax=Escherichia coli TaxID=562 RepID=UPI003CE588C1